MYGVCLEWQTFSGKRWFITFINDHTGVTWVFLLKDKFDAESVLKIVYTMGQTQFQTHIKIFRSDSGREFFNHVLGNFFFMKNELYIKVLVAILLNKME